MPAAATAQRHEVLFELLRRQNMSESANQVLNQQEQAKLEKAEAEAFLARALNSWKVPPQFAALHEVAEVKSAPEPHRDYDFFRAVGA